MNIRVFTWAMRGGPPEPPLYLRTGTGRCYRVHDVRRCRAGSQARYVFKADRIAADELPPGAPVFNWRWASRSPRRSVAA